MFYESFFPDPNTHFPWVREAKSLPYIKGDRAIRSAPCSNRTCRRR